jgi:hypothetical protein
MKRHEAGPMLERPPVHICIVESPREQERSMAKRSIHGTRRWHVHRDLRWHVHRDRRWSFDGPRRWSLCGPRRWSLYAPRRWSVHGPRRWSSHGPRRWSVHGPRRWSSYGPRRWSVHGGLRASVPQQSASESGVVEGSGSHRPTRSHGAASPGLAHVMASLFQCTVCK